MAEATPRILVSACLLGERTRYDGALERHKLVTALPSALVVPVCPEVDCGLAVPRDPIRVEQAGDGLRLVVIRTGVDLTERMDRWLRGRLATLADEGIAGCILRSRSPSCGLSGVPRFTAGGDEVVGRGRGLFADALATQRPDLILLEDDGLDRAALDRFFATLGLKSYR